MSKPYLLHLKDEQVRLLKRFPNFFDVMDDKSLEQLMVIRLIKPFPTCETCYELTRKLSVTNTNGVELYWCGWLHTYVECGWFCQKHQDFGGNND